MEPEFWTLLEGRGLRIVSCENDTDGWYISGMRSCFCNWQHDPFCDVCGCPCGYFYKVLLGKGWSNFQIDSISLLDGHYNFFCAAGSVLGVDAKRCKNVPNPINTNDCS